MGDVNAFCHFAVVTNAEEDGDKRDYLVRGRCYSPMPCYTIDIVSHLPVPSLPCSPVFFFVS